MVIDTLKDVSYGSMGYSSAVLVRHQQIIVANQAQVICSDPYIIAGTVRVLVHAIT